MEDGIRAVVAQAVGRFAACVGTLPPAASWAPPPTSSPSSPTPAGNCNIEKIHGKARWLIRMCAWVRAALDDAEDMDITDESVRDWLRELEAVADAAEDVLDEFPPEATLRLGLMGDGGWTAGSVIETEEEDASPSEASPRQAGEGTWEMAMLHDWVCRSGSSYSPHEVFAFLCSLDRRMEEIVSRFTKIKKPEPALQLEYSMRQMHAATMSARRATVPMIQEPRIVGRKKDLEELKRFLISSDAEECREEDDMDDVPVMAVVGMGGLGKTTLAQLAYNDPKVNQHFQLKSWVCVSEDFDIVRLTEAILQSLNVQASGFSQPDPLQRKLVQRLGGQASFLLVLDDVWEAENLNSSSWNLLTAPLRNSSAETKIIITSRSWNVAKIVPRTSTHKLSILSDEDCSELFKQHAFQDGDPTLLPNLVAIGENIARKCGGVPLVAKTFGGLLRTKDEEEKWKKILESEVWNATINQENSIIPILRLSYRYLPAPLKRCFRYCSLFPKGHQFDRVRIIRMWMALGYIKPKRTRLMEDIGQRYIDDLLSRSFFQCSSHSGDFEMHDLMHDLARCVSRDECYSVEGGKSCVSPRWVRHFSIVATGDPCGSLVMSAEDISMPEYIRSFLLVGYNFDWFTNNRALLIELCTRMEHLRVLDWGVFKSFEFTESIITHLKHLRYLRASNTFEGLPDSVGTLYHLQTLELKALDECFRIPNCISNLLNLRHLGCPYIDECGTYPVGIGKLIDLQTVPEFCLSPENDCAKLGELKDMNNIRGAFAIEGLHNLADVNEVKKACLFKKRSIRFLRLEWDSTANSCSIDDEMLESLKPNPKLEEINITGFKGPSYPSWLGDLSFSRLGSIELEGCQNLTSLPPLGHLPSLKSLYISEAKAVQYIGNEFFFGGFPQLEKLILTKMDNWKSWCGTQKGECPKLEKLYIASCGNLESLSLVNLAAVNDISIRSCPKLHCLSDPLQLLHLSSMQTMDIEDSYRVGVVRVDFSSSCLRLEEVCQRDAEYVLGECSNIRQLIVKRCSNLTSLPLGNLSALEYVKIADCDQLQVSSSPLQLWQLPSLLEIKIREIRGAEYIYGSFSPGSTEALETSFLELSNVDQLEVSSFLLNEFSHIRRLAVTQCRNVTSLPWTALTTLKYLKISECPLFQLLNAEQLPSTLQVLCIYENPCETEQCSQHKHFQRLKQVQQLVGEGREKNLYLVLWNVQDASEAANFCYEKYAAVETLELEWDCCANDRSNAVDTVAEEFLGKLFFPDNLPREMSHLQKLVIRGYTSPRFTSWPIDPFSSGLTSVTLLQ